MSIALIIPSAGIGSRFSDTVKKQYFMLKGKSVLYWTMKRLLTSYSFDETIIGVSKDDYELVNKILLESDLNNFSKNIKLVEGGKTRAETVYNCIEATDTKYLLIHDAVRPFVTNKVITDIIHIGIDEEEAVIAGYSSRDTVKKINGKGEILKTIDRNKIFIVQTPQFFLRDKLIKAYKLAFKKDIEVTDDSSAYELLGDEILSVQSDISNIKITTTSDQRFLDSFADVYLSDILKDDLGDSNV